jgi:predicted double-glycine peptidase
MTDPRRARTFGGGSRGRSAIPLFVLLALPGLLGCSPVVRRLPSAPPGQDFGLAAGPGLRVRKQVETFRQQRFRYVVPQRLDFSCGAAALATVFRYYYDDPVEEAEIIRAMLLRGDAQRIRREGFSLLDMKKYAELRGYSTKGFRIEVEVLERLAIPAIGLVSTRGYAHFVVVKGSRDGMVYVADPALGQRRIRQDEFVKEWSGVIFFIAKKRPDGTTAPLEILAVNRPGPIRSIREFSDLGLRTIFASPREF